MTYKDGAIYTVLDIFHPKTVFSIAVMLHLSSVASPCFWRAPQHPQHLCLNHVRRSPPILEAMASPLPDAVRPSQWRS